MSATEIDKAIKAGDLSEVKRLVEAGADLATLGAFDATPLSNAILWDNEAIIEYLLDVGADPSFGGCLSTVGTACGNANFTMCELLLRAGADPNSGVSEGQRPIDIAVFIGRRDLVELLISHGAKEFDLDELIVVAERGNEEGSHDDVVAYLKELAKGK